MIAGRFKYVSAVYTVYWYATLPDTITRHMFHLDENFSDHRDRDSCL